MIDFLAGAHGPPLCAGVSPRAALPGAFGLVSIHRADFLPRRCLPWLLHRSSRMICDSMSLIGLVPTRMSLTHARVFSGWFPKRFLLLLALLLRGLAQGASKKCTVWRMPPHVPSFREIHCQPRKETHEWTCETWHNHHTSLARK